MDSQSTNWPKLDEDDDDDDDDTKAKNNGCLLRRWLFGWVDWLAGWLVVRKI